MMKSLPLFALLFFVCAFVTARKEYDLCKRFDVLCVTDDERGDHFFSTLQEAIDAVVPLSPYNYIFLKKDIITNGKGIIVDSDKKEGKLGKPIIVSTHPEYITSTISFGEVSPEEFDTNLILVQSKYWSFENINLSLDQITNVSNIVHINAGGVMFSNIEIEIGTIALKKPKQDRLFLFLVRCADELDEGVCNDDKFDNIVVKDVSVVSTKIMYHIFVVSNQAESSSENVLDISNIKTSLNVKCKKLIDFPKYVFEDDDEEKIENGYGMKGIHVHDFEQLDCGVLIQNDVTEDLVYFDNILVNDIKVVAPVMITNSVIVNRLRIYHYNEIIIQDSVFEDCGSLECILIDAKYLTITGNTFKNVENVAINGLQFQAKGEIVIKRNNFELNGGFVLGFASPLSSNEITFTNNFVDAIHTPKIFGFVLPAEKYSINMNVQNNEFIGDEDTCLISVTCSNGGNAFDSFNVQNNIFSDFSRTLPWVSFEGCGNKTDNTFLSSNLIESLYINWGSTGEGDNFFVRKIDFWLNDEEPLPYYSLTNSIYKGVINEFTPELDFFNNPRPEDYVIPGPVQKIFCEGKSHFDEEQEICVCDNFQTYPDGCEKCGYMWEADCTRCVNHLDTEYDCRKCEEGYDISTVCKTCKPRRDIENDCNCFERFKGKECNKCQKPNYSFEFDCLICEPGFDIESDCQQCLPNYKRRTRCTVCKKGYDIRNECQTCLPGRDISRDCKRKFHRDY